MSCKKIVVDIALLTKKETNFFWNLNLREIQVDRNQLSELLNSCEFFKGRNLIIPEG